MRTLLFRDTVFIQDTRPLALPPRRGHWWNLLKLLFRSGTSGQRKVV